MELPLASQMSSKRSVRIALLNLRVDEGVQALEFGAYPHYLEGNYLSHPLALLVSPPSPPRHHGVV